MIAGITTAWAKIVEESAWLVLLAVAMIAVFLYVDDARVRHERDRAVEAAAIVCVHPTPASATATESAKPAAKP